MDKRAQKSLFSSYWKNGWIDRKERYTAPADWQYAKSKGLMFAPLSIDHDACINSICDLVQAIPQDKIIAGFVSGLSSRRLDWRSALTSYVLGTKISAHKYISIGSGTTYQNGLPITSSTTCKRCNHHGMIGWKQYQEFDLNVLNFERIKWGGVRHGQIIYMMFDLQRFDAEEVSKPTPQDRTCLKNILHTIKTSAANDTANTLAERLRPILKSNANERRTLIEILASITLLQPHNYQRKISGKSDWNFAEYWRGEDGYCEKTCNKYFAPYL